MVYILLNVFVSLSLGFMAFVIDRQSTSDNFDSSGLSVSLLLCAFQAVIFTMILFFKSYWLTRFTTQLMRIVFTVDGISTIMMSFGILRLNHRTQTVVGKVIRIGLYCFVAYICLFKFTDIVVRLEDGIRITGGYIFPEAVISFFPWTWYHVFFVVCKVAVPMFCFLGLMVSEEDNINQLYIYRCFVVGEGIAVMWLSYGIIQFLCTRYLKMSLLYIYPSLFLYFLIISALSKTNVPSKKGFLVGVLRIGMTYVVPGVLISVAFVFIRPDASYFEPKFLVPFSLIAVVSVLLSIKFNNLLSSMSRIYASDYEIDLEKSLASMDYSEAEMDTIIHKMYTILKQNVETTSLDIYMVNSMGELEVAYTSGNTKKSIQISGNIVLETLGNMNKNVLTFMEIEAVHDFEEIKKECYDFFEQIKGDAVIVLSEGHNIFGLISLGKKESGDHFGPNDAYIFTSLYSYFFVFGYYMRNISNKDIMGVVNREIKMSSQIIASIQENIDKINNPKIDVGYMMVPAKNIGGEFIDIIRLTDKRYLFVVGDLSGKGIAASMNMVILKSIIRSYLAETHNFKELVVKLNEFVRGSLRKGTIFAGLFAIVDFESDTMYYINCGIPALLSYTQAYNNVIEIQGSGHILGFVKDISPYISVKSVKLNRGDILVCCTDGLLQSHSLRGEQFGRERVQRTIIDNSTYPAQRMAQFTFDALTKFMSKSMEDDVSILILKYESAAQYVDEEIREAEAQAAAAAEAAKAMEDEFSGEVAAGNEVPADGDLDKQISAAVSEAAEASGSAESKNDDMFFKEDNSQEISEQEFAVKENQLEEAAASTASETPVSADEPVQNEPARSEPEPAKVVIEHDAPPEGFDTSELSELDDLLSDIGL